MELINQNYNKEKKYVQYNRIVISCDLHTNLYNVIFTFAKGISTWHKNNNSPRLTVSARIVAKRQNTTYHNQPNAGDTSGAHGYHTTSSTTYYVTFQVESGDRIEMSVSGSEYGKLTEGDEGKLTFQGTRYLQFNMEN